jgi:hypothetical protein
MWKRVRIPPHCESYKATKRELRHWGCNRANVSLWDINTEMWSSRFGVGGKANELAL